MKVKKIEPKPLAPMRDRWTIIGVEEKAIRKIKVYAKKYNMTTGLALSEVINRAITDDTLKKALSETNE